MPDDVTFDFEFEPSLARWAAVFGIRPATTRVCLAGDTLAIDFGPWKLRTPLANVAGAEITGPYRTFKVIGPAHLSFSDRGLTFATSRRRGVCIRFVEPVPALLPVRALKHPAATVTVTRAEALLLRLAHVAPGFSGAGGAD